MLHATEKDLVREELRDLREKNLVRVSTLFAENMKEVIKEEIRPDTTYADGIVLECSTTKSGEIIHITILDLHGNVLINEHINPYFLNTSFWRSGENRIKREDIEGGKYPHELYVKLKSIIDGTTKIIVYDQKHLQGNLILWRLDSTKVIECDEMDPDAYDDQESDNLSKIIDISREFAQIYGEVDIYGNPIPQSLYTCCQHFKGYMSIYTIRDMYSALSRCQTILDCYRDMEEIEAKSPCDILDEIYEENLALAVPGEYCRETLWRDKVTDGVVLSVDYTSDIRGYEEITELSITDMEGELLFNAFIHPYVVKNPHGEDSMYPHDVYYDIKEILEQARYVVSYNNDAEWFLKKWSILGDRELDENRVRTIEGWFTSVYGEMSPCREYFVGQSLYTCARTLGYNRYNEVNLGETIYKCKAIAYCYQKMLESSKNNIV